MHQNLNQCMLISQAKVLHTNKIVVRNLLLWGKVIIVWLLVLLSNNGLIHMKPVPFEVATCQESPGIAVWE